MKKGKNKTRKQEKKKQQTGNKNKQEKKNIKMVLFGTSWKIVVLNVFCSLPFFFKVKKKRKNRLLRVMVPQLISNLNHFYLEN